MNTPMRTLFTGNLTLEPQVAGHAEAMFPVLSDLAIYEFENEPPASVEWLRERFQKLESRRSADGREQWLNWVVRLHPDGLIGYVQATVHAAGSAEIAYEFSSAYWGRGLARQATAAMMAELASHYGVTRLFAVAVRKNVRSIRLLERLGFTVASAQLHAQHGVKPSEVLMWREIKPE